MLNTIAEHQKSICKEIMHYEAEMKRVAEINKRIKTAIERVDFLQIQIMAAENIGLDSFDGETFMSEAK